MSLTNIVLSLAALASPAAPVHAATASQPAAATESARADYAGLRKDIAYIQQTVFQHGNSTTDNPFRSGRSEGDDNLLRIMGSSAAEITARILSDAKDHDELAFGISVRYADGKTLEANVSVSPRFKTKNLIYGHSLSGGVFGVHSDGRVLQMSESPNPADDPIIVSTVANEDSSQTMKRIRDLASSLRSQYGSKSS